MNLNFDTQLVVGYHSKSQVARVLTEDWVSQNMYCPRCGCERIQHFENNRPVADFYCLQCAAQYELKSKNGTMGYKVNDGAYDTMISRITSRENPDFFFLSYSMDDFSVKKLVFVPKHFFTPSVIEKRKPLSPTARRAGWIGCNILLNQIPSQGQISIVSDGYAEDKDSIVRKVNRVQQLRVDSIEARGWLFEVLNCINSLPGNIFSLEDMYRYEAKFQECHPDNHNIKAKIRQQLQMLRDKNFISFLGNGKYIKRC